MDPLTIKKIRVISQTQNNEVYNVLYNYRVGVNVSCTIHKSSG